MDEATLFGLCAALLVGIGVYALIVNPQPLRKIIAFNVVGGGVFMLFGAIARRGAAAGWGGDPVPQALLSSAWSWPSAPRRWRCAAAVRRGGLGDARPRASAVGGRQCGRPLSDY
jgi:multicomponent Na+:H+ antiporter subunit C